jgi:hypothetical protein
MDDFMVILGVVELAASLASFAIVCIIFWRFGFFGVPEEQVHDEWVRNMPRLERPRRVQIWGAIALVLIIAAMVLFALAMSTLLHYGLWDLF